MWPFKKAILIDCIGTSGLRNRRKHESVLRYGRTYSPDIFYCLNNDFIHKNLYPDSFVMRTVSLSGQFHYSDIFIYILCIIIRTKRPDNETTRALLFSHFYHPDNETVKNNEILCFAVSLSGRQENRV